MQPVPPSEYWTTPGEKPKLPWSQWYADFLIYGQSWGWETWSDGRRKALLLNSVGAEARRLFRASESLQPAGDNKVEEDKEDKDKDKDKDQKPVIQLVYENAVRVLEKLFVKDTDVRTERVKFRRCIQRSGESALIYLTNLKEAVQKCSFGDLRDDMIRDQFIEGCVSDQLRDKLLLKDDLSLSRLEDIVESVDRGLQRRQVLQEARHPADTPVVQVAVASPASSQVGKSAAEGVMACYACGRRGHRASDQTCPASLASSCFAF